MIILVAEALDLEPTAMLKFFNDPPRNKVSLLRYPPPPLPSSSTNGTNVTTNGTNGTTNGTKGTSNRTNETTNGTNVTTNGTNVAINGTNRTTNGVNITTNETNGTNGVNTENTAESDFQGVGPHKDGGFLTYLLQATSQASLEAQNKSGVWIPVPPIPDTLVVNVGRSLESMTRGVCTATTHRVNLRPANFLDANREPLGPRFSFPVFQTLKLDLTSKELGSLRLPAHIADLVKDEKVKSDAEAFFAKYHLQSPGIGIFTARLTSHPSVGQRWYPEQLAQVLKGQREFKG